MAAGALCLAVGALGVASLRAAQDESALAADAAVPLTMPSDGARRAETRPQDARASLVPIETFVIDWAVEPGPRDPRLAALPALRAPPFDALTGMSLLDVHASRRALGAELELALPNGRVLRMVVEGVAEGGRYRALVAINRPGEADYLPRMTVLSSPDYAVFLVGQRHGAGRLIIVLRFGALAA